MESQKRPVAECSGCHREREIIDVKNNWCDSCRKKVARHPGEDPLAVLEARAGVDRHLASRRKLFAIDARLKSLIAALGDIGVSQEAILDIRRIVEPFLEPIAVQLGLERRQPEPKPKKETTADRRTRKSWARRNYKRKKKGLPRLTLEAYLAGER